MLWHIMYAQMSVSVDEEMKAVAMGEILAGGKN